VTDEVLKRGNLLKFIISTPHPSAKLTPSPQGEGLLKKYFVITSFLRISYYNELKGQISYYNELKGQISYYNELIITN
jgi:hypothetical protein